jgi:hypothetical protein
MSMPMFAPGMQAPYGYPYFHPGAGPQQAQQQVPMQHTPMPTHSALDTSSGTPHGTSSSLYPSLPPMTSMPAHSYAASFTQQHAQDDRASSSSPSQHASPYSPASTLSPKNVPSLSPASVAHSYSPSPESEQSLFKKVAHGNNVVVGQKRAFDDAAEGFLSDIRNKRFQENDCLFSLSPFSLGKVLILAFG